jgi:hypothetical protein
MTEIATFAYGPEHGSIEVWGKGRQPMPWFAPERLPGLFERTLVFDRLDLSGGRPEWGGEPLRWLFTGPQGALRIELTPFRLAVVQLYHDSFGLFPQEPFHDGAARNHPERVFATAGVPLDGTGVRSLTVRRDRHLRVVVSVDGCEVLTQRCLLDLFRHQLGGGAKASAFGRLLGPDALPAAMRIDPAVRHQTMIGWGGIGAAAAYRSMDPAARSAWWRIVAESNWLIQREYQWCLATPTSLLFSSHQVPSRSSQHRET